MIDSQEIEHAIRLAVRLVAVVVLAVVAISFVVGLIVGSARGIVGLAHGNPTATALALLELEELSAVQSPLRTAEPRGDGEPAHLPANTPQDVTVRAASVLPAAPYAAPILPAHQPQRWRWVEERRCENGRCTVTRKYVPY